MHHGEKNIYKRIFRKMRKGVAAGAGGAVILIAELFFTKGIISMKKKRLKAAAAAAVFLLIIVIFLPVPLRVDKELEGAADSRECGGGGRRDRDPRAALPLSGKKECSQPPFVRILRFRLSPRRIWIFLSRRRSCPMTAYEERNPQGTVS